MFKNILVPIDLERPDEWAHGIALAAELAGAASAKLTICSIVRDSSVLAQGDWLPISYEQLLVEARWKLESISSQFDDKMPVAVEVGTGTICGGILDVAKRISADLIVVASHRPGASDYVHAANAARIARRAPCSVLIARPGPYDRTMSQKHKGPKAAGGKNR